MKNRKMKRLRVGSGWPVWLWGSGANGRSVQGIRSRNCQGKSAEEVESSRRRGSSPVLNGFEVLWRRDNRGVRREEGGGKGAGRL
jgi:hypothetical protein